VVITNYFTGDIVYIWDMRPTTDIQKPGEDGSMLNLISTDIIVQFIGILTKD